MRAGREEGGKLMENSCYPVALNLQGKRCLVVGGGALAEEKVEGLLRSGAEVVVVSSEPEPQLIELAAAHEIMLCLRPYERGDLDGVHLVLAASDDRALNAVVAHDARAEDILVNAVDDIPNCDFFAVSIVRRGDLQIAISTNGLSPAFARWMREYLDAWLPYELGDLLSILAEVRREVKEEGAIPPYERWRAAIDDDVFTRLRHSDREGARRQIVATLRDERENLDLVGAPDWVEA
jgi:siroheme synthase-like protein